MIEKCFLCGYPMHKDRDFAIFTFANDDTSKQINKEAYDLQSWINDNDIQICMICAKPYVIGDYWKTLIVYVKTVYEDPDILYSL